MTFQLDDVVPWGRNLGEYVAMFALSEEDLGRTILGCGDGPASFNAEVSRLGCRIVSVDPIYRFTVAELWSRIEATAAVVAKQLETNADEFVWSHFAGPDELIRARLEAMSAFLSDLPVGLTSGRYVDAELPDLPYGDGQFDLALCSHFLFLYSEQRDFGFHMQALAELCRVADEVRIFPLLELGSVRSRHVDRALAALSELGHEVEIRRVGYEIQRGGNEMLRIVPRPRP